MISFSTKGLPTQKGMSEKTNHNFWLHDNLNINHFTNRRPVSWTTKN